MLLNWLLQHPKTSEEDTLFIHRGVDRMKEMVLTSVSEAKEYDTKFPFRYLRDNVPHLQLVHAIIDDNINGNIFIGMRH